MHKGDLKMYFVVVASDQSELRIMYAVDVRDRLMLLSEKMAKGRTSAVPLVGELSLDKVVLTGDKLHFYGRDEVIECKLVAAFLSFSDAERCYRASDLSPSDTRWLSDTATVLEYFEGVPYNRCQCSSIKLAM